MKEGIYMRVVKIKRSSSFSETMIDIGMGDIYELLDVSTPAINFFGTVVVTIKYQFKTKGVKCE